MALKKSVVGLDIGRYAVKAAWVEPGRGEGVPVISRTELLHMPQEEADSVGVIQQWLGKIGIGSHPCVLGLRAQECMFQTLFQPPGDPRTPEQAVEVEVVRFNDMAAENMMYGFSSFSQKGRPGSLLGMARPAVLEGLINFAGTNGLNAVDIQSSVVGLFHSVERCGGLKESPQLLINIGHQATEVAIGSTSGLMFARAFAGGGQGFTNAVAKEKQVPVAQADNLKTTGTDISVNANVSGELLSASELWISEIRSCLSVFKGVFPGDEMQPVRILMAGGGSNLRGLKEYVAESLDIEAVLLSDLDENSMDEKASEFSVAAGLGMLGLRSDEPGIGISLLPSRYRDELTFRRQKPFWIAAAVTGALILAVSVVGGLRDIGRSEQRLTEQHAKLSQKENLRAQIESKEIQRGRILGMAGPVRDLMAAAPVMRDLITLVTESLASDDWITMMCDAESYYPKQGMAYLYPETAKKKRSRKPNAEEEEDAGLFSRIIIEGYTAKRSLSSVKTFISQLAAAEFVESVDLLGDDKIIVEADLKKSQRAEKAHRFVIDVKIKQL
jgi:Tfp pilus assembly PilM family ATPase